MANYYGAIEGVIFAAIVLGFAGWQLWSLRDHKIGDRAVKDDEADKKVPPRL